MSVKCPYCGFGMQLKGVRAGRFGPRCQKCGDKFLLVISDDPNVPPKVIGTNKRPGGEAVSTAVAMALGIPPTPVKKSKSSRSSSSSISAAPIAEAPTGAPGDTAADLAAVAASVSEPASPADTGAAVETLPPVTMATLAPEAAEPQDPPTPPLPSRMAKNVLATAVHSDNEVDDGTVHPPSDALVTAVSSMETALPSMATEAPPTEKKKSRRETAPPATGGETLAPLAEADTPSPPIDHKPEPGLLEPNSRLGGYSIVQKLGQGGMGAVYMAKQVSLDRNVAVKILSPQLAADPTFVARFTREAYAAAQLTHHNIVQIYDIGEDRDVHFFSMEFVEGQTLHGTVKKHGRLDPEAAVGYVLQAARGLKFAHDHAMVHRDIKPENLMLNDQGMVKVADLGLVKRRGMADEKMTGSALAAASDASQTGAALSMGTPAYMAPEQAKDATNVDARADIYSLGCTLYDLLTGRPPFSGKTVAEVLTKHATEKVTPPDKIVKDVPKALSTILEKMLAKKPEQRYSKMDDVIAVLEDYLGVGGSPNAPFSPKEEHTRVLEQAVKEFNGAPMAKLRKPLIWAYFGLCALLTIMMLWSARHGEAADDIMWAGGFVGLGLLTFVSYIVLAGVTERTHFFSKLRQYVFGASIVDWAKIVLFTVVLCGILTIFHLVWVWLGFLFAAVAVAAGYHFGVDKLLKRQRANSIQTVEQMLKTMRIRGLDEEALRQFVCNYTGANWEEFYESLFGYEAKVQARQRWTLGERGREKKRWGAWRDPAISWIEARTRARKEERERKYLAKIEERKLRAQGVEDPEKKARKLADNVVIKAGKMRDADEEAAVTMARGSGTIVVHTPASLLDDSPAAEDDEGEKLSAFKRKYGSIWGLILGAQVRFMAGLIILIPFAIWFHINNPDFPQNFFKATKQTLDAAHDSMSGEDRFRVTPLEHIDTSIKKPGQDLAVNNLDHTALGLDKYGINVSGEKARQANTIVNKILGTLGSYQGGLAGAFLVFSALFRGAKMGFFMFTAAALIILCGGDSRLIHIPYPETGIMHVNADTACVLAGSAIALLGFVFGRD